MSVQLGRPTQGPILSATIQKATQKNRDGGTGTGAKRLSRAIRAPHRRSLLFGGGRRQHDLAEAPPQPHCRKAGDPVSRHFPSPVTPQSPRNYRLSPPGGRRCHDEIVGRLSTGGAAILLQGYLVYVYEDTVLRRCAQPGLVRAQVCFSRLCSLHSLLL
jgi:hypothetical protein